ncbi:MAG TPA: selenocysteine-specific translation elongation factor, partial [Actinomycetota bacterium]|nr:selenocysteine-specific translation elongation factor [Actinomycetota bacterium]
MTEGSGAPVSEGDPAPNADDASGPTFVVATAGHVDHGKSSLVARLTGMDPDRLDEEKRRGLTIELGYAWRTLPSGRELGFVDVPGHERFVRTMLAGVGPVRLVLFVVAADEGWKPQSEEHLEIVDVLGVDGAVIALTKSDLVDDGGLALVRAEVAEHVSGTRLASCPVVACSSITGSGLDELIRRLDDMLAAAPEPERGGRPRQFLDRVFSITGAGTVVTGTLTGGPVSVGDEVELVPTGIRARVRGLQTHHRDVTVARPVSRVAANLTGVERDRLARGDVLTRPGLWRATSVVEARITPVRSLEKPLTQRGAFKLHAGAAERNAFLRLYDAREVPRAGAFARVTLSEPLVLDVGDRFVLRESGRRETVAGGLVLDSHPPRRAGPDATKRLERRERTPRAGLPALLVSERRVVGRADLLATFGSTADPIEGAERVGDCWVSQDPVGEVSFAVESLLSAFHQEDPAAAGLGAADVRRAVTAALASAGAPAEEGLANAMIEWLSDRGLLIGEGNLLRLSGH